jgi:predicted metal-binding membrane protein
MFAAMMVPLIGAPVAYVRDRSFARRRMRAVVLFAAGYGLPWLAAGIALLLIAGWIVATESAIGLAAAIAAIALWQFSPAKQRCLNRCHAHAELAAFGAKADLDVLRFGLSHAWWCIGACFGLMLLAMLFTTGHLVAMAGVTLWIAGERLEKPVPPRWRWRASAKIMRIALAQMRLSLGRPPDLTQALR